LVRVNLAPRTADNFKILSTKDFPESEWEKLGIWPKRPEYPDGVYNNALCFITETEKELFEILKDRPPIYLLDKAIETVIHVDEFEEILSQQFNNDQMLFELNSALDKIFVVDVNTPMIDLKFYAHYNPRAGFKFAVDGFHNLPKDGVFVTLFSLYPAENFYSDSPDNLDLHFNSVFDWDSPLRSPAYTERFVLFKDKTFQPNLIFVVDVREVKFIEGKITFTDYAWTIVPVFNGDNYVNSGIYQMPLFTGSVKRSVLKELENAENLWEKMVSMLTTKEQFSKKKILKSLGTASVIVRLLDGQRDGHFKTRFDHKRLSHEYIPKQKLYQYTYNEFIAQKLQEFPKLKVLLGTHSEFVVNTLITRAVIEKFSLDQFKEAKKL
jgi:hypothetical protein